MRLEVSRRAKEDRASPGAFLCEEKSQTRFVAGRAVRVHVFLSVFPRFLVRTRVPAYSQVVTRNWISSQIRVRDERAIKTRLTRV